jgi:hypothetical protein
MSDVIVYASTGATLKFSVVLYTDETEATPVNFTGFTAVRIGIVDNTGTAVPGVNNASNSYASYTAPLTGGTIGVTVPSATTAGWAVGSYYFDILTTNAATEKDVILKGEIVVSKGYAS